MPGSARENDADVKAFVQLYGVNTVLDVGPGKGTYSRVLKNHGLTMDCVEIWEPYVQHYGLCKKYRTVTIGDIRDHDNFDYDLVIFGDVLEHMSREDALKVWERASRDAHYGLISVPIIHYPQGETFGNPYEEHIQDHLHPEEIRKDYGPFILDRCYEVTGTFIKDFRA